MTAKSTPVSNEPETTAEPKQIIITFEDHQYEVSGFDHPGEGIKGIYLEEFHGKEISEELDYYHLTGEPYEILEKARELGKFEGVKYLGHVKNKK